MVDYSSLENYRTERYRGFESLSFRMETPLSVNKHKWESDGFPLLVSNCGSVDSQIGGMVVMPIVIEV